MESNIAIKHLEQYIKTLSTKTKLYSYMCKWMNIAMDERIQSAIAQIELYKVGKGRLNF